MIKAKQKMEFAMARTALKYGLKSLRAKPDFIVLMPDYLCNVVSHPLHQLGLQIKIYPVLDDLSPDWVALEEIQNRHSAWALVMVHYFGQPQNIADFTQFCDKHQLLLIEDAAHGHGGMLDGKSLGTFGDIGISSPRKILNETFGGILYIDQNGAIDSLVQELTRPVPNVLDALKSVIRRSPKLNSCLKSMRGFNRNWSDPFLFQEPEKADLLNTASSNALIRSANWRQISEQRRTAWRAWQKFSVANGLETVFNDVHPESCPWSLPMYAKDMTQRNAWFAWGIRHGIPLFSWPALPTEIIQMDGTAYSRWQRLVCFPLDVFPKKYRGVNIES